MTALSNSPRQETILRLEARKSFSLGVWIKDHNGRPLDITGVSLRIVAKKKPLNYADTVDATNFIVNDSAEIVDAPAGLARFNLQASDLSVRPGEYPFAIIMLFEGYSTVLVKGELEIEFNTEFESLSSAYSGTNAPAALAVALRGSHVISVSTGPTLAPGTTSFTDEDKRKLDTIEEGAQVNVTPNWEAEPGDDGFILNKPDLLGLPPGGSPGSVLTKMSGVDNDVDWAQPSGGGGGGGGLDATGVQANYVPTANGVGTWDWKRNDSGVRTVAGRNGDIVLNQDDVADSATRVAMTPAERLKLVNLQTVPDWNSIINKPLFGSAALEPASAFLRPQLVAGNDITSGTVAAARLPQVSRHKGFSFGTAAPVGGIDGDLYFQYTA